MDDTLDVEDTFSVLDSDESLEMFSDSITADDLITTEEIGEIELKMKTRHFIRTSIKCNMAAYYMMKNRYLQYFTNQLMGLYYNGNIAIVRCCECTKTLDIWPCKEKRMYEVPIEQCGFCNRDKNYEEMDFSMFKAIRMSKVRKDVQLYKVNNK